MVNNSTNINKTTITSQPKSLNENDLNMSYVDRNTCLRLNRG